MNGVRRFLGGGGISQNPQPAPTTPPPAVPSSGKPSWPPENVSPRPSSEDVHIGVTQGLTIRKDKQKQPSVASPTALEEDSGNASFRSARSGSVTSSVASPTRSQVSFQRTPPNRKSSLMNGGGSVVSSPVAGPSSPRVPPPNVLRPRKSAGTEWKRTSGLLNIRDDLLMSLLSSEAVVDSRECEILSAEEVEDLKKEHSLLAIRLAAMQKKLNLETKIRDAALSLSRVNAAHRKVSKQTEDQLESAERKVDAAQKEVWRVSERASEVQRKLLEHRAGVLGYSVHKMEKKMQGPSDYDTSGMNTPSRTSTFSSATAASTPSKPKFDGAHLFAGHADAQIPKAALSQGDITALETNLRAATEALTAANKKQAEMARELSHLRLEKEQIETSMSMELQNAEETVAALEKELPRLEELNSQCEELLEERKLWEEDRDRLAEREREVERLERRLEVLEERSGEATEMERVLADVQAKADTELRKKDEELALLKVEWAEARDEWEAEKAIMEEDRLADLGVLQDELEVLKGANDAKAELDDAFTALQTLMQLHNVELSSQDKSLQGLLSSVGTHLEKANEALERHAEAQSDWDAQRVHLENESRSHIEKHGLAIKELEDLRRERDDLSASAYNGPPIEYKGDSAQIVALLQPLWALLPSPEARASKLSGQRHLRAASTASNPSAGTKSGLPSLSDTDVRSLRTLYDSRSPTPQQAAGGTFSVEAFVARVQALIIDDRGLIERLIRFVQAHDLLKKNAERAQKLAQDSNVALETYQRQVMSLEDQNMALMKKQDELITEIAHLQAAVDRAVAEKREIEMHAADQAETCHQLTEANNALSAKTLTLAAEAASAPEIIRKQLEGQLTECREALRLAQEEVDAMRSSEQTQRIALLDELNSMQTENGNLRAQLRAVKK
ncbi:Up-regulated during septation-domain-containing protein [Hygrophoropsis aurantiaca]|uniref:Up-regulated during septation-domain-containing protein n=1 Tax=Hygrophoropsis aurantiaca TaxID=72124 RepID=A0ACB8A850_9AGAM|nr:Up-regulated during septation-domain-containing protein [Hygrophoropsis aurantiaca]